MRALGQLTSYLGGEQQKIELPAGSTLHDLMFEIDSLWGDVLPPLFWDASRKCFSSPVILMVDNTTVKDLSTPLQHNQKVLIIKVMAGG